MKAYDDINYIYSISDLHMLYIKLALSSLYDAGVPHKLISPLGTHVLKACK